MQWLNLNTSFLSSPEFVGSEPVQRGTWICLMAYCAVQENGGVIADCKGWGERQWMTSCGITKAEANADCPLWEFDGDDLHLWGYPIGAEEAIRAKRAGGAKGGKISRRNDRANRRKGRDGQAMLEGKPEGMLEGMLEGEPEGMLEGELKASREAMPQGELQRKEREKEGKEKKEKKDIKKEKNDEKIANISDDNDPPAPKSELESIALRLGMRDFTGWYAYWQSMNWITAYGGIEHAMTRREIQRSMLNWKTNERKIEDEKHAREKSANPTARHKRPAGFIEAPAGKYTAENCGF